MIPQRHHAHMLRPRASLRKAPRVPQRPRSRTPARRHRWLTTRLCVRLARGAYAILLRTPRTRRARAGCPTHPPRHRAAERRPAHQRMRRAPQCVSCRQSGACVRRSRRRSAVQRRCAPSHARPHRHLRAQAQPARPPRVRRGLPGQGQRRPCRPRGRERRSRRPCALRCGSCRASAPSRGERRLRGLRRPCECLRRSAPHQCSMRRARRGKYAQRSPRVCRGACGVTRRQPLVRAACRQAQRACVHRRRRP